MLHTEASYEALQKYININDDSTNQCSINNEKGCQEKWWNDKDLDYYIMEDWYMTNGQLHRHSIYQVDDGHVIGFIRSTTDSGNTEAYWHKESLKEGKRLEFYNGKCNKEYYIRGLKK
jgi:hypothetical protein